MGSLGLTLESSIYCNCTATGCLTFVGPAQSSSLHGPVHISCICTLRVAHSFPMFATIPTPLAGYLASVWSPSGHDLRVAERARAPRRGEGIVPKPRLPQEGAAGGGAWRRPRRGGPPDSGVGLRPARLGQRPDTARAPVRARRRFTKRRLRPRGRPRRARHPPHVSPYWAARVPEADAACARFGRYQRVQAPDAPLAGGLDQALRQGRAQSAALPAVLYHRRVLGPPVAGLARVTYDRDDLVSLAGIQRRQREVVGVFGAGEVGGLLVGQLSKGSRNLSSIERSLSRPCSLWSAGASPGETGRTRTTVPSASARSPDVGPTDSSPRRLTKLLPRAQAALSPFANPLGIGALRVPECL